MRLYGEASFKYVNYTFWQLWIIRLIELDVGAFLGL